MKSKQLSKPSKTQQNLLTSIARTIGSTLGTLAAKGAESKRAATRPVGIKKTRSKAANNKRRKRTTA